MNLWTKLKLLPRVGFRKRKFEAEMEEEMRLHLDLKTQANIDAGMNPRAARYAALRQFGWTESLKETCRERRGMRGLEYFLADFRFGGRRLGKHRGFAALAVLTLALGLGANTTMFSVINAFMWRRIAVDEPDRLVGIYDGDRRNPAGWHAFSYANYLGLRDRNTVFESVLAHQMPVVGLREGNATRKVLVDLVSANFFSTLGVRPTRGRAFSPEEESNPLPVAVVSHAYWKRGGFDPELVGKTLQINAIAFTVIGIAPEPFTGLTAMVSPEMWLPLGVHDLISNGAWNGTGGALRDPHNHSLLVLGRLKAGQTLERAQSQLRVLGEQLEQASPTGNQDRYFTARKLSPLGVSVQPMEDSSLALLPVMLMLLSILVLLIVCLNLANMMLAEGESRRREIAVRLALGGGRARILRQLLTEAFALSLLGGSLALLLTFWIDRLLVTSLQSIAPFRLVLPTQPDWRTLAAALGFCVLSTMMFGLAPARRLLSLDLLHDLKEQPGTDSGRGRGGHLAPCHSLAVAQIALSLAFLTAAGLFLRSTWKASHANPGFPLDHGLYVELTAGQAGYDEARGRQVLLAVAERLRQTPGVSSVSLASSIPFSDETPNTPVLRAGASGKPEFAGHSVVGTDYFKTLGVPLLRGREFTRAEVETTTAPRVAIIDEDLARRLWPGGDALGQFIQLGVPPPRAESANPAEPAPELQIVGLVPSLKMEIFDPHPTPRVYEPFGQQYRATMLVHVKEERLDHPAEAGLLNAVRNEVRAVDQHLAILTLSTLEDHLKTNPQLWLARAWTRMFLGFGALALFLAVVGVYGLNACLVARRTREIGIRLALGARPGDVLWMILRGGSRLALIGVSLGLLLAAATGKILSAWLYQVGAFDPLVFSVVPLLLAAVTLAACYLPARRAARLDPMAALREE